LVASSYFQYLQLVVPQAWESPAAHRHELNRPQLPNALASFFTLVVFVDFIVLLMYEVALGI
jgi:hypothetical protein